MSYSVSSRKKRKAIYILMISIILIIVLCMYIGVKLSKDKKNNNAKDVCTTNSEGNVINKDEQTNNTKISSSKDTKSDQTDIDSNKDKKNIASNTVNTDLEEQATKDTDTKKNGKDDIDDTESDQASVEKKVVVIDAGHQAKGNSDKEPIGPGAKQVKPKVSSGTQGIKTRIPEYKINLEVGLKLEKILQDKGYDVIMIRTTNDVDISNSERATVANEHKADAFIRIHCNGSDNHKINGALTMCQTKKNIYCGDLYDQSHALADNIIKALCEKTGATNQGIIETDTMSGINWCQVPVTIVEMGYMTNGEEDKLLSTEEYQKKLASGIADGIEAYFNVQ